MKQDSFVVITRSGEDAGGLKEGLEKLGVPVYELPTIHIVKRELDETAREVVKNISAYDYVIFTSAYAVKFFVEALRELQLTSSALSSLKIVAVGQVTAEALHRQNLTVDFVPSRFTSDDIVREIGDVTAKKILLPRSVIGSQSFVDDLQRKGAEVAEVHLYTTLSVDEVDTTFGQLVLDDKIGCITFASSSSVNGFPGRIKEGIVFKKALEIPAVCIGPRTAEAARELGFQRTMVAEPFTTEGIIKAVHYALS